MIAKLDHAPFAMWWCRAAAENSAGAVLGDERALRALLFQAWVPWGALVTKARPRRTRGSSTSL